MQKNCNGIIAKTKKYENKRKREPNDKTENSCGRNKKDTRPICLNDMFEVNLSRELQKLPCEFYAIYSHCQHKNLITQDTKSTE